MAAFLLGLPVWTVAQTPPQPARIGGTITVDGTQLTQAVAGNDYTIVVRKPDGTDYIPNTAQTSTLTDNNVYIIDIPIFEATIQPGGAEPTKPAVIQVFFKGTPLSVTDPANGQMTVGASGSLSPMNLTVVSGPTLAITAHPVNQTVCAGAQVMFSVVAMGTNPTYQWRKNGATIPSATGNSYTIPSATANDVGSYDVVVSSGGKSITSNAATLTVNPLTAITTPPANQTVCAGASATFSVAATGTMLGFQWRKNGSAIPGATGPMLALNNVTTADAGIYDVVVTGVCGTQTSATATLTVNTAPTVTSHPANQSSTVGGSATFTAAANGTPAPSVQWQVSADGGANFTNIPGATNTVLTVSSLAPSDNGKRYGAVFTNSCGTVTSNPATLTVSDAFEIVTYPSSQTVCAGQSVTFSVTAKGPNLGYQWRKNGSAIPGATNSSYTIPSATTNDAGSYAVAVTSGGNSITSSAATLTVNATTIINAHPTNQTVCVNGSVTFSVTATGTNLTYQWRKNGSPIPGANSNSYTINSAIAGDAGNYDVVITGACGNITSNAATLTVNSSVAITAQPVNQTVCANNTATFSVIATGTNLTYQWRKNGAPINGATSNSFTIASVTLADAANYEVVITSACGNVTSNPVSLTVTPSTTITAQLTAQTKVVGQSVSFSVTTQGANLTYQWRKNGSPISGATGSSYSIASVALGDAGDYDVLVIGTCGTATSNAAKLTVNNSPPVVTALTPSTAFAGDLAFTLGVVGTNFISGAVVRWNGQDRQTTFVNSMLVNASIPASDIVAAGTYQITVVNPASGGVPSNALSFVVSQPPSPIITSLSRSSALAGDLGFTIMVNGDNFTNKSTVQWNGAGRTTRFISKNKLEADIAAADIANPGTALITVFNPPPGGATSTAVTFTILPTYEGDVSPRPSGNGDGKVTMADWVQLGRFYVGLDKINPGSELQRVDCYPKETKGDGRLTIGDWVQAGRYAVGLDSVIPAGGMNALLNSPLSLMSPSFAGVDAQARTVRARDASFQRSQVGTLQIEFDAQGNENAIAFSLNFDPKVLSFVDAKVGDRANGASLQVSVSQAAGGRLGFAVILSPGQQLVAGNRVLLTLRFIPTGGDGAAQATVSFGDQVFAREIVDAFGSPVGQVNYTGSTITISGRAAANVSAASYVGADLAADSIASAFGTKLATMKAQAVSLPLPNTLGGTTVKIKDGQGGERIAPLFFVSPNQLNYQIPTGTAEGIATVTITNGVGEETLGLLNIGKVAPGIFSSDSSGTGWAAADVVYVKSDQSQALDRVARFDGGQNKFVPVPIDLSTDAVVLTLYGTGIRHRSDLANVKVIIGGVEAVIDYADKQGQFFGLDQINVRLPKSLLGRGEVPVAVSVEGKAANSVNIYLK
ncbi:MAG: hypothetical protein JST84_05905 [Acidobacteria bacterium]|nr:hypothetical protein [Acidobacteriota bacterium]